MGKTIERRVIDENKVRKRDEKKSRAEKERDSAREKRQDADRRRKERLAEETELSAQIQKANDDAEIKRLKELLQVAQEHISKANIEITNAGKEEDKYNEEITEAENEDVYMDGGYVGADAAAAAIAAEAANAADTANPVAAKAANPVAANAANPVAANAANPVAANAANPVAANAANPVAANAANPVAANAANPVAANAANPVAANASQDVDFATALILGLKLGPPEEPLDLKLGLGIGPFEEVVGWKKSHGKVGIICDKEFPGCEIFRIRKLSVLPTTKLPIPEITRDRRAGKYKDKNTSMKWSADDVARVVGIAISVPPGYSGAVPDLVLPAGIPKKQRAEMRLKNIPIPPQPRPRDVQLCLQWYEKLDGRFISWENRAGVHLIYKNNADNVLYTAAKHFEARYKRAGGTSVEPQLPELPRFFAGSSTTTSRETSPEEPVSTATSRETSPAQILVSTEVDTPVSTATSRESSPKPAGSSTAGKDKLDKLARTQARTDYKDDWRSDNDIPDDRALTSDEAAKFSAAFDVYWLERKRRAAGG
jgi:hypothetical protein